MPKGGCQGNGPESDFLVVFTFDRGNKQPDGMRTGAVGLLGVSEENSGCFLVTSECRGRDHAGRGAGERSGRTPDPRGAPTPSFLAGCWGPAPENSCPDSGSGLGDPPALCTHPCSTCRGRAAREGWTEAVRPGHASEKRAWEAGLSRVGPCAPAHTDAYENAQSRVHARVCTRVCAQEHGPTLTTEGPGAGLPARDPPH